MKRIVIFDLDGTILDTLTDLENSVNYVLVKKGLNKKTTEEIRSYVGNGIELLMRRALPLDISEAEFEEDFKMFKKHYEENLQNETKPYLGIMELMVNLINQGMLLAVVSNKFQEGVNKLVKDFFGDLVNVAVGTSDTIRPKPEIDSIKYLYENLNIKEEDEVYFIGDSEVDIQTAKNASIPIISVTWGFRPKEELVTHNPDYIVDEPNEIYDIIVNKK